MDTAVYERQQKEDAAGTGGVRNVAAFVAELAEQCAAHISCKGKAHDISLLYLTTHCPWLHSVPVRQQLCMPGQRTLCHSC